MHNQYRPREYYGSPKDTVSHTFANTNKHSLVDMGADLSTQKEYDDYLRVQVHVTSGSIVVGYGSGTDGVPVASGSVHEFFGSEQCSVAWITSTVDSIAIVQVFN